MRERYAAYQNLEKTERIDHASKDPSLENKRFLLSDDPVLRERVKTLQDILKNLTKDYPEIAGMTFFGSTVFGYANESSDIDAFLYIDHDVLEHATPGEILKIKNQKIDILSELQRKLIEKLGLSEKQVQHIDEIVTDEKDLRENCRSHPSRLVDLFRLSTGNGIARMRSIVFDELNKMGERGEKAWETIVWELWLRESQRLNDDLTMKRRKLYPWSLWGAENYFTADHPVDVDDS